jgi:hypothetical protein
LPSALADGDEKVAIWQRQDKLYPFTEGHEKAVHSNRNMYIFAL